MNGTSVHRYGVRIFRCDPDGTPLRTDGDALDVIGAALHGGADLVVLPAGRLTDAFFDLSTGVAGAIVQKFVNYRLRLAVVGDLAAHLARSSALRDFVGEANRGTELWFVADDAELESRLERARGAA